MPYSNNGTFFMSDSYYDPLEDDDDFVIQCDSCKKKFDYSESIDDKCPYCDEPFDVNNDVDEYEPDWDQIRKDKDL